MSNLTTLTEIDVRPDIAGCDRIQALLNHTATPAQLREHRRVICRIELEATIESILDDELEIDEEDSGQEVPFGMGSVEEGGTWRVVADQTIEIEVDDDALLGWYADRDANFSGRKDGLAWKAQVVKARRMGGVLALTLDVSNDD